MKKQLTMVLLGLGMFSMPAIADHHEPGEKKMSKGAAAPAAQKTVKVEVGKAGIKPSPIEVAKGTELTLEITRTAEKTCMDELKTQDGSGVVKLPLNQSVKYRVGKLDKAGEVKILCGMDMTAGVVKVN